MANINFVHGLLPPHYVAPIYIGIPLRIIYFSCRFFEICYCLLCSTVLTLFKQEEVLQINIPGEKPYYISRSFLEWFVGFADAEGNFNIKLTSETETSYKFVQFAF